MGDGQKTENKGRQVKKKDYILKRTQIAASLSFLWKSWDRNIFNCSKYWKKKMLSKVGVLILPIYIAMGAVCESSWSTCPATLTCFVNLAFLVDA